MAKIRIHELAKELKINSKDLVAQLQQMGYAVKNHMSTIEENDVGQIRRALKIKGTIEKKGKGAKDYKKDKSHDDSEKDYRKRAQARKEEIRQKKEQDQRKVLAKVRNNFRGKGKKKRKDSNRSVEDSKELKKIIIEEQITVQELANLMHVNGAEVIKKLIDLGVMATINQVIDSDTATLVASEFGIDTVVRDEMVELEAALNDLPDKPEDLRPKPPVITVMGHVDHGKTSLLDFIRHTDVIATEAGGITQHIGAYQIETKGKKITFLDTPGHEAFTTMRARGAQVTDIAVLVVAADDGVMPQTVEAINHAKAANVPIVVAINKMDKPAANPDHVKQQLAEYGLVPEEWGGNTICVPVSAKKGTGIDQLLEMLLLVAEMEEYKANPFCPARGTVIEAELDKGRGPVATVLIQKGTLSVGDHILVGTAFGNVRAMYDFKGRRIKKALPGTPVAILGLSEVPAAGDLLYAVADEKTARQIAEKRLDKKRKMENVVPERVTLDDLFNQIKEGKVKELNLVVKADVQGSVEALIQALNKLNDREVRINIIHSGVGAITETDVMLASASNALIIGFNVRPDTNAKKAAETQNIEMRLYRVIYEALDDIKAALEGMLEPIYKEVSIGRAEVRELFHIPKVGTIAGCNVLEGKVVRNGSVRLIREGVVVYEGKVDSLKRFKNDAREVAQGHDCGIGLDRFQDIKIGDILEVYEMEEIKRELMS
ncbi:MAG: translation initiation factor IF-2 [Thermacetogeniaceae bacterium]|jgi:translation initiation factor IF-2|nr:translation initiation factor IF-2 [Thermoanaerobacterales bacterium]NLN20646.1 translation initiation factor IF-2 [Syntrophomonadaceae bacterium]